MKLIAHAVEDGWAYVYSHDGIWLIKPPYAADFSASDIDVERAIITQGYLSRDLWFETRQQLEDFLRSEVAKTYKLKEAPEKLSEDILSLSSKEEIDFYLTEVYSWILADRISEAETVCRRLQTAKNVTEPQLKSIDLMLDLIKDKYLETYEKVRSK